VAELAAHKLIGLRVAGRSWLHWKMFDNGVPVRIAGHVRRSADNGLLARLWALDGHGIVLKSRLDVAHDLAAGRLRQVLPGVSSGPYPLVLALAPGAHLNARTRAFGDFLRDRLATPLPQR
jgi:DNA-binding transcriptional LysR family regulator